MYSSVTFVTKNIEYIFIWSNIYEKFMMRRKDTILGKNYQIKMIQVFKKKNNEYEEIENHPQPERKGSLKRLIQTVHEFHIDYKCESCGKSFTGAHNF